MYSINYPVQRATIESCTDKLDSLKRPKGVLTDAFLACNVMGKSLSLKPSIDLLACAQIEGVVGVTDLHVWELKPGMPLLATHLNIAVESDGCEVLSRATAYCRSVGITHTTIQLLHNGEPCCVPLPTPRSED